MHVNGDIDRHGRIAELKAEREAAASVQQWVEISHQIDAETGRIAQDRWKAASCAVNKCTDTEEANG
jgi:hypothetical protein